MDKANPGSLFSQSADGATLTADANRAPRDSFYDRKPDDLRRPFGKFGRIKDVYLPRDYYTGDPRGFAFIQYFDPEDAADAKYHMDGQMFLGREITVVFAEENRKKPSEMRARERVSGRGRSYDRRSRSRSPGYSVSPRGRSRPRSRSYSPAPKRKHHSRSPSPRERSLSRSPVDSRSRSASPAVKSPHRERSLSVSRKDAQIVRNSVENPHSKQASAHDHSFSTTAARESSTRGKRKQSNGAAAAGAEMGQSREETRLSTRSPTDTAWVKREPVG
ncbi:serine/arginine-rich SC35-like splicing factor SCL33 [Panicum miliaceum]|uniref:Serine/arginine-rich SC35-like splicing factor SCL33 n=1 Tax=Panicum miliaceum TaxID=4540 RepID=A0A3L6TV11_PANMI|nr:serine/arginine-rich SC35-like splicing factor SCL33 [Panicum miliaceum]